MKESVLDHLFLEFRSCQIRVKAVSRGTKIAIGVAIYLYFILLAFYLILFPITYSHRLLNAAENGDLATVTKLLDKGANLYAKDGWSGTPIKYAAVNGHTDIVALLIKRGVDINSRSTLDRTPLMHAANSGRDETVKFLIENGADISLKDEEGNTALMLAFQREHHSTVSIILGYLEESQGIKRREHYWHLPQMLNSQIAD